MVEEEEDGRGGMENVAKVAFRPENEITRRPKEPQFHHKYKRSLQFY